MKGDSSLLFVVQLDHIVVLLLPFHALAVAKFAECRIRLGDGDEHRWKVEIRELRLGCVLGLVCPGGQGASGRGLVIENDSDASPAFFCRNLLRIVQIHTWNHRRTTFHKLRGMVNRNFA